MKLKAISLVMVVFGMLTASARAQGPIPPGAAAGAPHPMTPGPMAHGPAPVMPHARPVHPGMAPPMEDCGWGPLDSCGGGCGCGGCCGCAAFGRSGGCGCGLLGNLFGCNPCCEPCWRLRAEALSLDFDEPDEPMVTSTIGGQPVLGNGDLDFDREVSFRVSLERRLPCNHGLELTYFGLHHWRASAQAVGTANIQSPYQTLAGAAVAGYSGANLHRIAYSSDLHNAEINYWVPVLSKRVIQATLMYGWRYIHINEDWAYDGISATTLATTDTNTANNIVGPQVGVMAWVPLNCQVSFRFDGKVGAFYNFAEQETQITQTTLATGLVTTDFTENADTNKGAFGLDLSAVVVTQLTPCSSIYVGYQMFYLNQLVLASEQFNPVFPTAALGRPTLIDDEGRRLYHGPISGFEFTW